jgi:hypothetical protein
MAIGGVMLISVSGNSAYVFIAHNVVSATSIRLYFGDPGNVTLPLIGYQSGPYLTPFACWLI